MNSITGLHSFRMLNSAELAIVAGGINQHEPMYDPYTMQGQMEQHRQDMLAAFGITMLDGNADAPGSESQEYSADVDYCGSGFFNLPDSVYGVDISEECYEHDRDYGPDSTMDRADADWKFAQAIYEKLINSGVSEGMAGEAAMFAHGIVMFGGVFAYEGQGSRW